MAFSDLLLPLAEEERAQEVPAEGANGSTTNGGGGGAGSAARLERLNGEFQELLQEVKQRVENRQLLQARGRGRGWGLGHYRLPSASCAGVAASAVAFWGGPARQQRAVSLGAP